MFAGEFQVGELLWVDNDSTNLSIVLKNTIPNTASYKLLVTLKLETASTNFGKVIGADDRNTTLVVGASESNKVYIFQRTNDNTTYNHAQTLDAP